MGEVGDASPQGAVELGIAGVGPAVEIGRGGFATVYRATQAPFDRTVAIKVIAPMIDDAAARRRFYRECRVLGQLSDASGIVDVFDAGELLDGRLYLLMRYLPGGSLHEYLANSGAMPWPDTVSTGVVLGRALAVAHHKGVVHADVKPANVLLTATGLPQLADFGIATLIDAGDGTMTSSISGTPAYLPPEALDDQPPAPERDVYSLAATLHACLTGRAPFGAPGPGAGMAALIKRITHDTPTDLAALGVPDAIAEVIASGMAKDPAARPTAAMFAEELESAGRASEGCNVPPRRYVPVNLRGPDLAADNRSPGKPEPASTVHKANRFIPSAIREGSTANADEATLRPILRPDKSDPREANQTRSRSVSPRTPAVVRSRRKSIGPIAGALLLVLVGLVWMALSHRGETSAAQRTSIATSRVTATAETSTVKVNSASAASATTSKTASPTTAVVKVPAPPITVPTTGDGGPATESSLASPLGMAVGPDGSLYVADSGHHRIRKIDTKGVITTVAGIGQPGLSGDENLAVGAQLSEPHGVAVSGTGVIYIADTGNHRIRKISANGVISTVAGSSLGPGFEGDGGQALRAMLSFPSDVALAPDGSLIVGEVARIRKIRPDGVISTLAGNGESKVAGDGGPAVEASLIAATGVEVVADGTIVFIDLESGRIRRIGTDGIVTTIAGNGECCGRGDGGPATAASIWRAQDIAIGRDGSILLAEGGTSVVRRIGPEGGITTVAGTGTEGFAGDGSIAVQAKLFKPAGVAIGPNGVLYIADTENHRIRTVSGDGLISTVAGTGSP